MIEDLNWYVVYTRPRWEKKVAQLLEESGFTPYCPLNRVNRQWSDRKKTVQEPLFRGYVFVQVPEHKKWEVKDVNGVLNFVYWLGKPARVKQSEIDTIRKFLQEFEDVTVFDPALQPADTVAIKQGIMMDYEGIILEVAGNKAKVKIQSMGIELSAVFEKSNLAKIVR